MTESGVSDGMVVGNSLCGTYVSDLESNVSTQRTVWTNKYEH